MAAIRKLDRIFNNRPYYKERRRDANTSYVCTDATKYDCPGRGTLRNEVFTLTQPHNHAEDGELERKEEFTHQLCKAASTQLRQLRHIYDNLAPVHWQAAQIMNWAVVSKKMKTWRGNLILPEFNASYSVLYNKLNSVTYSPLLRCVDGAVMDVEIFNRGEDAEVIIFSDPEHLGELSHSLISSVSFASIANYNPPDLPVSEILIISALVANTVKTCLWVLIKNKLPAAYTSVVNKLTQTFGENVPMYGNLDHDLHEQLQQSYTHVKGTMYYLSNIIWAKAKELDVRFLDGTNGIVISQLCSLSLLNEDNILAGYGKLCEQLTLQQKTQLANLLESFEDEWLVLVGPSKMSFYLDNDAVKDFQQTVIKRFNKHIKRDADFWDLMTYIIQKHKTLQREKNRGKLHWVPRGRELSDPRSSLKLQWVKLQCGKLEVDRFVKSAAFLMKKLYADCLKFLATIHPNFKLLKTEGHEECAMERIYNQRNAARDEEQILQLVNPNARRMAVPRRQPINHNARPAGGNAAHGNGAQANPLRRRGDAHRVAGVVRGNAPLIRGGAARARVRNGNVANLLVAALNGQVQQQVNVPDVPDEREVGAVRTRRLGGNAAVIGAQGHFPLRIPVRADAQGGGIRGGADLGAGVVRAQVPAVDVAEPLVLALDVEAIPVAVGPVGQGFDNPMDIEVDGPLVVAVEAEREEAIAGPGAPIYEEMRAQRIIPPMGEIPVAVEPVGQVGGNPMDIEVAEPPVGGVGVGREDTTSEFTSRCAGGSAAVVYRPGAA
ncbi:uncharacterized protein LOC107046369 [Diachasma alloeum]|uniref:uncharacterized protein LOC107046369 n=1 Tax=Diachasma alloeum TaxID=454923 RepID=UPI0007382977|nr:uncharacterized protein LOC107046369 [Diachasma alloeum]